MAGNWSVMVIASVFRLLLQLRSKRSDFSLTKDSEQND